MPSYRAYPVSKDNHVAAAPSVAITCKNEQDGLQKTQQLVAATTSNFGTGLALLRVFNALTVTPSISVGPVDTPKMKQEP